MNQNRRNSDFSPTHRLSFKKKTLCLQPDLFWRQIQALFTPRLYYHVSGQLDLNFWAGRLSLTFKKSSFYRNMAQIPDSSCRD